jgi:PiT family inorganic phosphate transporter
MDPFHFALMIVILGLIFDYTNGFHDAANVVSTVIATRVLAPAAAIVLAAVLNTLGATQVSAVAKTITTGIVDPSTIGQGAMLAAIASAILWNCLTWLFGLPSSSTYALIGALIGASWHGVIFWQGLITKVVIPMVLSPILGLFLAFIAMKGIQRITPLLKGNGKKIFGHLQIGSASIIALSHGLNDAQKSMGLITLGLYSLGFVSTTSIPLWVVVSCAIVMGLGTATGGMRIIKTVGFSITKLETSQGFTAEMCSSLVILIASLLGMPISSTHLIVGSIAGVGSASKGGSIKWVVLKRIAFAWLFTLPGSAIIAYLLFLFF